MHSSRHTQRRAQDGGPAQPFEDTQRQAPQSMPRDIPTQSRVPKQAEKPQDVLPKQKPVTNEVQVEAKPAKWKKIAKRVAVVALAVLALSMAYLFLLLGEPDTVALEAQVIQEETIRVPMAAMEVAGGADLSTLAATFGKPVLALYGGAELQKVSLYDTAFQGSFARRACLTYMLEDGQVLTVESLRPTAAASLMTNGERTSLNISNIYSIGGYDAARMDSSQNIYIIASSGEVVYGVCIPASHQDQLAPILKQTTLLLHDAMGE